MENDILASPKTYYADKEVIAGQYIASHEKEFDAYGSFDLDEEPKYIDFVVYDGTSFPYPVKDAYRIAIQQEKHFIF